MVSPAYYLRLVGKKVHIGARACKKLSGVAGKRFPAPAPPLLVAAPTGGAAPAAVAARDTAGLAAGVAVVGAVSAVVLLAPLPLGWRPVWRWLVRRWLLPVRRRPGVPSGGSAGNLLTWAAGD
jgi:hypothetical protein